MNEQDSISVQILMPIQERKRATTVIANWQFSTFSDDPHTIKFFILSSEIYMRNLINRKEEPIIKDQFKGKIPAGTILHQPFTGFFQKGDGKQEESIPCEGELIFAYIQYRGLKLTMKFQGFQTEMTDYISAKFLLWEGTNEDPKPKSFRLENEGETWNCMIQDADLDKFLKNRLAVEIIFQRDMQRQQRFAGIKNNGSTCYMNSILQILFFLKPLRKMVIDYKGEGKIMLTLRDVFLSLMHEPQGGKRPVDAEDLILAYGRFAEQPRRQQDTHQFLLGFLEELEGECPSLAQLWQGQSRQILQSMQEQKQYKSVVKQDFNGLDLPLQDFKGNTFGELIDSLRYLLINEQVQDKIDTDEHGKISVVKSRQFIQLPPVLFLTLKRYEFKKFSTRPTKVLADLHYPSNINLGFLLGTPTGEDMEYQLFAVTVHKGQHYCSGHYYSFINTSEQPDSPLWLKFDDSRVFLSSISQAESYTGGKKKTFGWNKQIQRFLEREYKAEDTAYILAYYKKEVFREYQEIEALIPQEWINKKRIVRAQERINEEIGLQQVEVAISDLSTDFDIFGDPPTIPIGLKPNEDIVSQLNKLDFNLLGCKVGTVWKVSKRSEKPKLKRLVEFADLPQTPARIFDPKRGHRQVDYLLIIPSNVPIYSSMMDTDKLGLIRVTHMIENEFSIYWKLIRKQALTDFINEQQKKTNMKGKMQIFDKQQFEMDWNDTLALVLD